MVRGFYNLTSAMLTQTRRLDVVSQNMVNTSTAGYKEDTYHHIAFDEYMLDIIGNTHATGPMDEIGATNFKIVSSEITTSFEQGVLEETNLPLDFAIEGEGFFAIQWDWEVSEHNTVTPPPEVGEDGEIVEVEEEEVEEVEPEYDEDGNEIVPTETVISYTRSGQFSLDAEGYLFLPTFGYVLDPDMNQIQLPTDNIRADAEGNIYNADTDELLATLGIFQFEDNDALQRDPRGLFISAEEPVAAEEFKIHHKYIERSNSTLIDQMALMMTTQRALQSAATVSKIYDQVMSKITNDLGRL